MIQVSALTKTFGTVRALDGLDLMVSRGSICAVLGPNGAGKTTAVRVLATLTRPDAGTATVGGFDVRGQARQVRSLIGLAGQHAAVDDDLTGRENLLMVGRMRHLGRRGAARRAAELLERFGLADAADRLVKTWSGGMRRRLDIVAALVTEPAVLFLDEPTTGLDPRSRTQIWATVRDLARGGTTVLLTTQYLEEADRLADDIVIIDRGRLVAQGSPHDLKDTLGSRVEVVVDDAADLPATCTVLQRWATGELLQDLDERRVSAAVPAGALSLPDLVRHLDLAGVHAVDASVRRPSLDEVFLDRTSAGSTSKEDAA